MSVLKTIASLKPSCHLWQPSFPRTHTFAVSLSLLADSKRSGWREARTVRSSWRVRGAGAHLNPRRAGPGQGGVPPLATVLTISGFEELALRN